MAIVLMSLSGLVSVFNQTDCQKTRLSRSGNPNGLKNSFSVFFKFLSLC